MPLSKLAAAPLFCALSIGHAALLQAQELVLEEILVTAQLRSESLQEVPVSVNALSGDKLFEAGLAKIEDLQAYVPNLSMSETGIGTNIYMRGIGSGINQGFEQSVGMYADGVYYGRAQLARAPFLDLARIEVLRGPQNILYGKNSVAGAISVISAKPSRETEGLVSLTYEPENEESVFDLMLSGALSERLSARLAYRNRQLDGYLRNANADEEPNRDEQTLRLSLNAQPNDQLDITLKLEHSDFDIRGRQIETVNFSPSLNPAFSGANWAQFLASIPGVNANIADTQLDGRRAANGDYSNNSSDNITLTIDYPIGDNTLTAISSFMQYDYAERCDCDFTSADLFFVESFEDYRQLSQELRLSSAADSHLEWIGGIYYQDSKLDFDDRFHVTPTAALPTVLDLILPAAFTVVPGDLSTTVYPSGAAQQLRGIYVPRQFRQDSTLWSVFLQTTWHIHNDWRLTLGGRYNHEEKRASRVLSANYGSGDLPYNDLLIPNTSMGIDYLLGAVFKVARNNLRGKRNESNFAPSIIVEYDLSDDSLGYLSWSRGFKAGGYDVRSNAPPQATLLSNPFSSALNVTVPAGAFEYEEEKAETLELGLKTGLADGAAELNIAYFYTQYDDLQVSIFDGVLGFNVGNAAKANSQGIELDGRWKLSPALTLSGSLAWLDFEFEDFAQGQCTQLQRILLSSTTTNPFCDYQGQSNQYVADISAALSISYLRPLSQHYQLLATLDGIYTSDYNPSQNLDRAIEQKAYHKINARLALAAHSGWEIALIGKNLTDREIITYANDIPLAANLTQSMGYYAFVEPGRTIALQGSYRF